MKKKFPSQGRAVKFGRFRGRVLHAALSGWSPDDGVPPEEVLWIGENLGPNETVTHVFFHCGINAVRGDLTKARSAGEKATIRARVLGNFRSLLQEFKLLFSRAEIVYLGSTNVRISRWEGDGSSFIKYPEASNEVLKERYHEISNLISKISQKQQKTETNGWTPFHVRNGLGHIVAEDIFDEWGHPAAASHEKFALSLEAAFIGFFP